jgi:hypothetical protein
MEAWRPPPDVRRHSGAELPPDADFFYPPPPGIGRVISADTNLNRAGQSRSMLTCLLIVMAVVAICGVLPIILTVPVERYRAMDFWEVALTVCGIEAAIAATVVFRATVFRHACSYVGDAGAALFILRGSRQRKPSRLVLLFSDAVEVRTRQVERYVHGINDGTSYRFTWTDANRRELFRLFGRYGGLGRRGAMSTEPFQFAVGVESAWNLYQLPKLREQLKSAGYVQFNRVPGKWVRVGRGYVEFGNRRKVERLESANVEAITLVEGQFRIVATGGRLFGRRRKYFMGYANLANARLFLWCLAELTGWQI